MEDIRRKIGETWEDLNEMCEDLMCLLPGTVYFGNIQNIPFSSGKMMEMYDDDTSVMLKFTETEETVKLISIY